MKMNKNEINQAVIAEIKSENAAFGYVASKMEIANDYWNRGLTQMQRVELGREFAAKTTLQTVNNAVAFLATIIA
tara:strand:+ start:386 stop:610 length:225 start_codon:yes stop_codon:yes gene_type:complete